MPQKVTLNQLLPLIEAAFEQNKTFKLPITGTSMNPLLYQNRDFVIIKKPQLPLSAGDVPLYRRTDGSFVLHRVVGANEKGYIMCGDNQFVLEYGITDRNIIGVACDFIIDGKSVSVTDPQYVAHTEKFLKNIKTRYPLRRMRYNLSNFIKGINHGKSK